MPGLHSAAVGARGGLQRQRWRRHHTQNGSSGAGSIRWEAAVSTVHILSALCLFQSVAVGARWLLSTACGCTSAVACMPRICATLRASGLCTLDHRRAWHAGPPLCGCCVVCGRACAQRWDGSRRDPLLAPQRTESVDRHRPSRMVDGVHVKQSSAQRGPRRMPIRAAAAKAAVRLDIRGCAR